jgi:hypothetical protein
MRQLIFALAFALVGGFLTAQNFFHEQFSISDSTNFRPTLEGDLGEDLVYLMDRRITELVVEDRGAYEYFLMHQVTRCQTDAGIEAMNEIYIRLADGAELLAAEARVVGPDGEVKTLRKKDIREDKDYKGSGKMVFFALEGLEINSVVEFFYIEKEPARNVEYGRRIIQGNSPKYAVDFALSVPEHLEYEFKSYNGLPEVQVDETFEGLMVYRFQLSRIPAIHDEKFAHPTASKMRMEYKLVKNHATGRKDFVSFGKVSENVYGNLVTGNTKKGLKMVAKELKKLNLEGMKPEEKIMAIELYLKRNYNIVGSTGRLYRSLEEMIPAKIVDHNAAMRLLLAMFDAEGIDWEVVLTSDRTIAPFDPDFANFTFLQTYLIYFPKTKKFIFPESSDYRYGYFPLKNWDNHGLFIRRVKVGDMETGAGKIKWIDAIPYEKNYDKFLVSISLDETLENAEVDLYREMQGNHIMNIQTNFHRATDEGMERFNEIFIKFLGDDAIVNESAFLNVEPDAAPTKPMIVKAKMTVPGLLETAGEKILLKVGEAIGTQSELYQESVRELPINHHTHLYDRVIEFVIPDGYRVANLDDINLKEECLLDDKTTALFHSYYKLEGNKLTIHADEFYKDITLPVELYDSFQKVINAAADFNKIVLVLEKA